MADENGMSTPADNRKLRKIIYTATGYGILTKAEIALMRRLWAELLTVNLRKRKGVANE